MALGERLPGSRQVGRRRPAIELRQRGALGGIGDDDPAPVLDVAAVRRLAGDLDALLDLVEVDGRDQVKALAYRTRGRQELVGLGEVERCRDVNSSLSGIERVSVRREGGDLPDRRARAVRDPDHVITGPCGRPLRLGTF